mmetsp:Transcript_24312/g.29679  ORF Transcript_24312/g.29679 Transcript_24312/m.29679 type:complete len:218 (+) Transcript_24312:413-1066(+)
MLREGMGKPSRVYSASIRFVLGSVNFNAWYSCLYAFAASNCISCCCEPIPIWACIICVSSITFPCPSIRVNNPRIPNITRKYQESELTYETSKVERLTPLWSISLKPSVKVKGIFTSTNPEKKNEIHPIITILGTIMVIFPFIISIIPALFSIGFGAPPLTLALNFPVFFNPKYSFLIRKDLGVRNPALARRRCERMSNCRCFTISISDVLSEAINC